jgi:DnaJ-class molecular chaperone
MTSYYDILHISPNSTALEIKQSYRKLSLKYHPDKYKGPPDTYIKINAAYEVLNTQEKRAEYDKNLEMQNIVTIPEDTNNFDNNVKHPIPILRVLKLKLTDIVQPLCMPIEIQRWHKNGSDHSTETEILYVNIPQGVDSGEIILVKEKGNSINGKYGDVKIVTNIENNTVFTRDGLDLVYNKELTLKESLSGFSFKIIHLSGKTYTIDNHGNDGEVVPDGHRKVFPNMGIVREGGYIGNLIIAFNVIFPTKLPLATVDAIRDLEWNI